MRESPEDAAKWWMAWCNVVSLSTLAIVAAACQPQEDPAGDEIRLVTPIAIHKTSSDFHEGTDAGKRWVCQVLSDNPQTLVFNPEGIDFSETDSHGFPDDCRDMGFAPWFELPDDDIGGGDGGGNPGGGGGSTDSDGDGIPDALECSDEDWFAKKCTNGVDQCVHHLGSGDFNTCKAIAYEAQCRRERLCESAADANRNCQAEATDEFAKRLQDCFDRFCVPDVPSDVEIGPDITVPMAFPKCFDKALK